MNIFQLYSISYSSVRNYPDVPGATIEREHIGTAFGMGWIVRAWICRIFGHSLCACPKPDQICTRCFGEAP